MTSQSRLDIVVGALNMASAELRAIQKDIGTLETKGTKAGLSIGQAWQKGGVFIAGAIGALYGLQRAADATVGNWQRYTLQVGDFADQLGTSTEEASALMEMAGDLNVELGSLEMGFKTMARQGISPSIEGLIEARSQIMAAESPTQRLALAQKLLGRAGAELLPIFEQLNEQQLRDYIKNMGEGQIVTAGEVARARELRDALDATGDAWKNTNLLVSSSAVEHSNLTEKLDRLNLVLSGEITYWEALGMMLGGVTTEMRQAEQMTLRQAFAIRDVDNAIQGATSAAGELAGEIDGLASMHAAPAVTVHWDEIGADQETKRLLAAGGASVQNIITTIHRELWESDRRTRAAGPEDRRKLATGGMGGEKQAAGGPLAPLAIVGEQGWETVVRTPHGFVVVPHDESVALARLGILTGAPGMALGGEFGPDVEGGGFRSSQYTTDEYLRSISYSAGAGYYLGTGGKRITGRGSGGGFGTSGTAGGGGASAVDSAIQAVAGTATQTAAQAASQSVAASSAIFASEIPAAVSAQTESQMREQRRSNEALAKELGLVRREIRRQTKGILRGFRDQMQQVL